MQTEKVQIKVQGMTCGGCVKSVQQALSGLDGVTGVQVDLHEGRAWVTRDPARAPDARLVQAIEDAGFDAAPWSDDGASG